MLIASVIGKITRRMEIKADKVGYLIDEDADWIQAHTLLIRWEYDGLRLSGDTRTALLDILERVSVQIGMASGLALCTTQSERI